MLTNKGTIFISIDDNEQANLKILCDQIFGEKRFIACIPRITTPHRAAQEKFVSSGHDYVLIYSYSKSFCKIVKRNFNQNRIKKDKNGTYVVGDTGAILASEGQGYSAGGDYDYEYNGVIYKPIDKNGKRNR
jgi:adenine-specific DNA-methyltransferase